MNGRTFTASLKPAWSEAKIKEFLIKMIGTATIYIINHDKDMDEKTGELIEVHTHIMIEYATPRKLTTVANLLEVENNFIEIVRNKKGILRYLIHMDEVDKHRYDYSEVYTNSDITYEQTVLGDSLTDKDIADYIIQGRGLELLGLVPSGKLRTIQSFLHFDSSNRAYQEIRELRNDFKQLQETIEKIENIATSFQNGMNYSVQELTGALGSITEAIGTAFKSGRRLK